MSDARLSRLTPATLPDQRQATRAARSHASHAAPPASSPTVAERTAPRLPGGTVVVLALLCTATLALLDRSWTGRLSQFFDLCFVLVCLLTALTVRRSGMFTVGVAPPLMLMIVLSAFTIVDPATLTTDHLAFASTLLTGLAHHAGALVAGHGSALAILVARGTLGETMAESI